MGIGEDEPMRDAPAPKPRRRFAPQLVEETVKTSSSNKKGPGSNETSTETGDHASPPPASNTTTARPTAPTTRTTRDASVQVDDIEMRDAPPPPSKISKPRRFAPMPLETTFDSYRVNRNPHGPTAELTPDPSPTTPQPPSISVDSQEDQPPQQHQHHHQQEPADQNQPEKTGKKPRRKFAPQLIETSRRARKTGQEGPATKPTDKTDITPGTNHIYAPKPKRKPAITPGAPRTRPSTSGTAATADSEDDDGAAARFLTPRRQQSMKPHPNTRRGTKSSFTPDLDTILSSESGSSSEENEEPPRKATLSITRISAPPDARTPDGYLWNGMRHELRDRRESCDDEFSGYLLAVAAKEAHRQRQFEQVMSAFPNGLPPAGVEHFVARDNSDDEDDEIEQPDSSLKYDIPQLLRRQSTDPGWAVKEMRAHAEKLANLRAPKLSVNMDLDQMEIAPPPENPLWTTDSARRGDSMADCLGDVAAPSPALYARADSRSPGKPENGLNQGASPFGLPFGFRAEEDDEDAQLRKMRQAASPPMLGKDLVFRKCLSPQATRMEPTHPYRPEEKQRDITGAGGLWGGFCCGKTTATKKKPSGLWRGYCTAKTNEAVSMSIHPPSFLSTPAEPSTPGDLSTGSTYSPLLPNSPPRQTGQPKGLHLLAASLDERLKQEKARKELEERILKEFDDAFVTQVYNYISLGYPATARAFDDELSKISGIEIEQLRKDDHLKIGKGFMLEMELRIKKGSKASVDGGSSGDDDEVMLTPEEDERRARNKPPRWRALKLYIREWARQHPSFNDGFGEDENPLAWGVRARRGSWAI
ncbi:hypothetical protein DL766_007187 [Monosporascus sp. MC13-8B]|uniref:Uncharacterized protein n=1 Tax=Monosporascus cannonballus TaxID=155416 RepID=A0ABY0GZZ6_9PEZI|nr:hypothetical protein DL762_007293 [Monosporascus cannonballus]RYO94544.1 hypothetical protein DL763_004051 [Monosporascus cannonballus]RYP24920.1 hypothetical protein DL766_007187 [Monosporascus sp. MC13-8B]